MTLTSTIQAELAPKLSTKATIVLPDHTADDFQHLTNPRGQVFSNAHVQVPQVAAVVRVFNERDVQETIRYANQHGFPFLARSGDPGCPIISNGGDGDNKKEAIQIDFRTIDHVEVAPEGDSVTVGAGVILEQLVKELDRVDKETVTGHGKYEGVSDAILEGRPGLLQGKYGLPCDQVIYARMVLPDGEAVTISDDSNPDLFHAVLGSGRSFGLVVEWELRIHDKSNPAWSHVTFTFSGDKLEQSFSLASDMAGKQSSKATHWFNIVRIPEVDPDHPIVRCTIVCLDPLEAAQRYAKPFQDIGPLQTEAKQANNLSDLLSLLSEEAIIIPKSSIKTASSTQSHPHDHGRYYSTYLNTYDPVALRKLYNEIDQINTASSSSRVNFNIRNYPTRPRLLPPDDRMSSSVAAGGKLERRLVASLSSSSSSLEESFKRMIEYIEDGMIETSDPEGAAAYLEDLQRVRGIWDPEGRMRWNP